MHVCRYMKTPDRVSILQRAKQTLRNRDRRLARMMKRLELDTSTCGVLVDVEVKNEIEDVISKHGSEMESLPKSDFCRIFWSQQV